MIYGMRPSAQPVQTPVRPSQSFNAVLNEALEVNRRDFSVAPKASFAQQLSWALDNR